MEKLTASAIFSITGEPKTGKTFLSFTFPDPIKVFSFDLGADFIRSKFPDKKIDIENLALPIIEEEEPEAWALPIWNEFYTHYKQAVESGEYQTVVIDTATAVWAICRQAVLEEKQEDKAAKKKLATNEYITPNLRMTALFSRARVAGVNLVTIQYMKEKWEKNQRTGQAENTGELVLDGWKATDGQADVVLEMTEKDKGGKSVMVVTIKANRFDREQNRKSFEDTTYEELVALLGIGG